MPDDKVKEAAGIFKKISDIASPSFSGLQSPLPDLSPIDNRTRQERREDLEKAISKIDKESLEKLKNELISAGSTDIGIWHERREDIENAIIKFVRLIDDLNLQNSNEERKLAYKKMELKLDALHDWKDKFRLFFFRVLASFLLIITLFAIGYIEHEYEWAYLPMSKYFNPTSSLQLK